MRDALAPFYWSLREGAQRCLKAADLQGKHPSLLGDWLGPTEALLQHATSRDMELMLKLRQFFPNRLPVRAPSPHDSVGVSVQRPPVGMHIARPCFCAHVAGLSNLTY